MGPLKHLAILAVLATAVYAKPKEEKSIGIFNIVKFPNDVCESASNARLGTCFTAEECTTRNGVASGTCAEGYGVCCLITLACGGTSSSNCTHLTQMNSATPAVDSEILSRQCSYTICPASATVNRIRLDFTTFDIAGPVAVVADGTPEVPEITNCLMDRFTVTGTSGPYPIICGVNNGQHIIVDTDGTRCVTAVFSFGMAAANRGYDIHVIQYDRSNAMGGYPNCLQFFTAPDTRTGIVSSFNWQGTAAASTHLALQRYDICVRPEVGFCVLCWSTTGVAGDGTAGTVGTFGVSNGASVAGTAMSGAGPAACPAGAAPADSNDFVIIPNGLTGTVANIGQINQRFLPGAILRSPSVFCGRYLNAVTGSNADGTICTRSSNFRLGVRFDNVEGVAAAGDDFNNEEAFGAGAAPLGTQGFELAFTQLPCN